jgi:DNA polymerase III subunit delta'
MFRNIKGQDRALTILNRSLERDKIAHSYLFYGPEGVGKFTAALYFGMAINCLATSEMKPCGSCSSCHKFLTFSHPDLIYIFPFPNAPGADISVNGEISSKAVFDEYNDYVKNKINTPWKEYFFTKNVGIRIGSIRMLEHRIYLTPNEAVKKIFLVEDADMMTRQAANAFLKTLEEPPEDTVLILTTSRLNSLLPTILSRCQKIPFNPVSRLTIEQFLMNNSTAALEAKIFSRISNGSMEKALRLAEKGKLEARENTLEFLKILIAGKDLKFVEFSNDYRRSSSRPLLKQMISHLILWVADLAYYKYNQNEIVNLDQTDIIQAIYNMNPEVENYVSKLTDFLENMSLKLDANVNQQLILIEIYNILKDTLSKKSS